MSIVTEKQTAKHTPGPWRVSPCSNGGLILIRADGKHGAHPQTHLQILPEEDAKLIAAAPELLEALRNCVDGLNCQPGYVNTLALKNAQDAIRKATGE